MIQEMKVQSKKQMPLESHADGKQAHAFSDVFLSAMKDSAYDTLYSYLKAQKVAPEALEMLVDLMQLTSISELYKEDELVHYHWNDEACYAIGHISHNVPKLGGQFIAPSGIVLK